MFSETQKLSPSIYNRENLHVIIPVDRYIEKYNVRNKDTEEALKEFPVLCYLLGSVSENPSGNNKIISEGSAMFGLKDPEDAMRWKGIFNHIMGAARHVYFLADKIAHATPEQKQKLIDLGYTSASVSSIDPDLLRDHKLIDHAGRRQSDEFTWYAVNDNAHHSNNSELNTVHLLEKNNADPFFVNHMKEEDHRYLSTKGKNGRLKDIHYAVLTYGDWTYGQKPMSMSERFVGLRASKRADEQTLDTLEALGNTFESDIKKVFGDSIIDQMQNIKPYPWEEKIKRAYAASAGLSASSIFST